MVVARELFPLPSAGLVHPNSLSMTELGHAKPCRKVLSRLRKRCHTSQWDCSSVDALNSLAGQHVFDSSREPSQAQYAALSPFIQSMSGSVLQISPLRQPSVSCAGLPRVMLPMPRRLTHHTGGSWCPCQQVGPQQMVALRSLRIFKKFGMIGRHICCARTGTHCPLSSHTLTQSS